MTRKQIYQQIAAFTGDWKSARRKAEIFDNNCLVALAEVKNIRLSFGRRLKDMEHYVEDRDTLHFRYTTKQGEEFHFSILD